MTKKLLLISVLLLLSQMASAMTWSELEQQIEAVESGETVDQNLLVRLSEMVQMLVVMRKAQTSPGLFCPPQEGSLDIDEIVSMLRAQARASAVAQEALAQDQTLVQSLLLQTFIEAYPC